MRCLIITIRQSAGGGESRKQRSEDAADFTIGRGSDQTIRIADLKVPLLHSRISLIKPGRFKVEALTPAGVVVDGQRAQQALIKQGSILRVGDNEIRIMPVDEEHDICIEVHPLAGSADATSVRVSSREIPAFPIGMRRLSWLAFALVLIFGLGLPLAGYFMPDLRDPLRSFGGGDSVWHSGNLSSAHQYFARNCDTCHAEPFKPVADERCESCHDNIQPHAASSHSRMPALEANQCERCHREHNGDDGFIPANQTFCSDCHADSQTEGDSKLFEVSDFGLGHPQFSASLLRIIANADEQLTTIDRVDLDNQDISEQSNLLFSHESHLDPAGLETAAGSRVLECADCHQQDISGRLMQPINFIQHCGECHQLNFDPRNPDLTVPHGRPAEIVANLTGYYSELALRGASGEVNIESLQSFDRGEILLWARIQATRTAANLFSGKGCANCHSVQRTDFPNRTEWQILPARIAGNWFPRARFEHRSHTAMACNDCHDANTSAESNDVLMPGIETCRNCHAGEHTGQLLASTCISCHGFHSPEPPREPRTSGFNRNKLLLPEDSGGTLYLRDRPEAEQGSDD